MKTIVLLFLASLAAFAQDTPSTGYYAGGWSGQGAFAVLGKRVSETTSVYSNLGISGTTAVTAGMVRSVLQVNQFRVSLLGEAGAAITGNAGFAGAFGGVLAYDISRWTKTPMSVFAVMKETKTATGLVPVYGIGISRSF